VKRRSERAATLIETLLAVAILALLVGSLGALFEGRRAYAVRSAVLGMQGLVADARAVAQSSGTGATVVIAAAGGGFTATLYPYRPLPGADLGLRAVRTLAGEVALTPLAVFISSSGTASAAAWSPPSGTLATEPPCNGSIGLQFSDGFTTESHAIPCAQAQLR
jgi:type II secretory pathway pseudopilin PulG